MMNERLIKVIGIAATVVGLGVNLVTAWVDEKKMDEKIDEKINEAFAKKDEERGF